MKATHTKGKWEVSNRHFLHIEVGEQWICQLSSIKGNKYKFFTDEAETERLRVEAEEQANAEMIVKAVNSHDALFQMVKDLKNCIHRLTQDGLTQFERDAEAQWEGEAVDLLLSINPDYYQNANTALKSSTE